MKKRCYAGLPAALLAAVCLCACGGQKWKTVPPAQLGGALLAACENADALTAVCSTDENAGNALAAVSELNAAFAESFFLAWAKEGKTNADEILVILVKNVAAMDDVTASLEAHLESRKKLYAASAPLQKEKLDAGEVFAAGRYAVLLVSDEREALKTAFLKEIEIE